MRRLLSLLLIPMSLHSAFASAQCDGYENDFFRAVADQKSSESKTGEHTLLVVLGRVKDIRTVRPRRRPSEMDVEVLSVLEGEWKEKTLISKTGSRTESYGYENYIPGKKYLMSFVREEDEDGSLFFFQGPCAQRSLSVAD